MEALALDRACQAAFTIVDATNGYIATQAPWALAKQGDHAALDRVLWTAAEALRVVAVLLSPVMPGSCELILARLGAPAQRIADLSFDRDTVMQDRGERRVTRADSLWPRLDAAPSQETPMTDKPADVVVPVPAAPPEAAAVPAPPAAPPAPAAADKIAIDDFMKVDLRVAKVLTAERVPNSKKLMKLGIDLGTEQRTIVAGIAEAYEAEGLVGRSIVIVANLKPAKLMGIESNGMVLAASAEGGKPVLLGMEQPPAPGTRVR
jgi:methionyl-tRNA synthetase